MTADPRTGLLRSVVDVARSIFGARAASVLLHEPETAMLRFAAVSGEGAGVLEGRAMPAASGISGWVLATRQPLAVEDTASDPRWARDIAADTGYVPKGIMAAPMLVEDRAIGVLSVLDRPRRVEFSLIEMDLLGAFAHLAAQAYELAAPQQQPADPALVRLAAGLDMLEGPERAAATRLLEALADLVGG